MEVGPVLMVVECTVNVDIFALYIFSPYLRFLNVHENIYPSKITIIIPLRPSYT